MLCIGVNFLAVSRYLAALLRGSSFFETPNPVADSADTLMAFLDLSYTLTGAT